jgi:hypothetical protein
MIRKSPSFEVIRRLVAAYIDYGVPVIVARSHDLWSVTGTETVHVCPRRRSQTFKPDSAAGRFLLHALEK